MNTSTTPQQPDLPETPHSPGTGATDTTDTTRTLADDVFPAPPRTEALPTAAATATARSAPVPPALAAAPAEPEYLSGPAPFALVLGLLGLVVAGSVLVGELTDVSLPWNDLGPWSVVAAGLLVLLVGAIGLRSSRARG